MEALKVTFVKRKDEHNIYKPAYFNSRAQIVINANDFLPTLGVSKQKILNSIGAWLSERSGWTISSIDEHYINTVVYLVCKNCGQVHDYLTANEYVAFYENRHRIRKKCV